LRKLLANARGSRELIGGFHGRTSFLPSSERFVLVLLGIVLLGSMHGVYGAGTKAGEKLTQSSVCIICSLLFYDTTR